MSRYDVYPNPSGLGYLLDVQADILQQMSTRAAVLIGFAIRRSCCIFCNN